MKATELNTIIEKSVAPYLTMTDYQLRTELKGCAFNIAIFCKQHFDPGTENYNYLFSEINKRFEPLKERAYSGIKKYAINIEYKQKGSSVTFGYECTKEERTEAEAIQRAKERPFRNLHTNRVIKPIFTKFEINLIP